MGKTDDRDRSVDRLLETALRGRRGEAPPGSACLEAETIAAWADGTLSVSESRAVELHLSVCPHCQEVAAVFAQSAPAAETAPAGAHWWRRPQIRWLTPALAGAAAVALVVWTSSPTTPEPAKTTPPTLAQNEPAPQRAESERSAPATVPPQARADEQAANAAARKREEVQKSDQGRRAADAKGALARQPQDATLADARAAAPSARTVPAAPPPTPATGTVSALPPAPVAAPPPPTEPPARPTPPPAAEVTIPLPGQVAGGVAQKGQMAEAVAFRAATMVVVAEFSAPIVDQRFATTGGAGGRGGGGASVAARQLVVSPIPPVRWRVLVTGVVEKSVDGGVSWTQATIEPPLPITGGVAPQPLVCWLIGRGGVVLRSTDGAAFSRVAFPITADLTAIRAVSALEATITTSSGLIMTTTDGGKTWR